MTIGSHNPQAIYAKLGVKRWRVRPYEKVGIDTAATGGKLPLNGLRHAPSEGTTGWYIWASDEIGREDEFFRPMHVEHLQQECPAVLPYLALPPGWRFLIAEGYEDVWFDDTLLSTS